MRAWGTWVAAAALALFALGIALQPLQTPAFTRMLVARFALSEVAGLGDARMLEVAEEVRVFVVDGDGQLPESVDGRAAFDASAVSHLKDVHTVLAAARYATGLLALGLTVWLGFAVARRHMHGVAAALKLAAIMTAVLLGVALLASFANFDAFFSAFHSLFFASGTWQFPADALLILVFPEPFWAAAGASWALCVAAIAGVYALLSVWLGRGPEDPERGVAGGETSPSA